MNEKEREGIEELHKEMVELFGEVYDREDSILAYGKASGVTKTFFNYTAVVGVVVLYKVVMYKIKKDLEIEESRKKGLEIKQKNHWNWFVRNYNNGLNSQ
jgi:hypothetical protein